MKRNDLEYQNCIKILKEELLPAMGCTEPIAISYGTSVAKDYLGCRPDRVVVEASGNIIKNVKSVIVPNTDGLKGIEAAAAAGIIAGNSEKQLEVISVVSQEQKDGIREFLKTASISITLAESPLVFDIIVTLYAGESYVKVRIANYHTNIVLIEKDGEIICQKDTEESAEAGLTDRSFLSVEKILEFANMVELEEIKQLLSQQIEYNMKIAEEGIRGNYGANIGSVLLAENGDGTKNRAKAMAAAGSDARMNGCELPVVINSGSGNQGITVSVPIVVYAKDLNMGEEKMYRALALANLLGVHQKTGIGRLSAYCGAISAGAAAGCGIAYMKDGSLEAISHTLVNALAIVSGVVCDGAKASCAGKIATAVDAGILGYEMYCHGQQFVAGDGIVKKGVEKMIASVGRLGKDGMKETDREILRIMISD